MNSGRVLIVDDDPETGTLVAEVASELGFEAQFVTNQDAFRTAYGDFRPTILFVDLHMPDSDGIETLNYLHSVGCQAEIFMISGFDGRVLKSARDFGLSKGLKINNTLQKPIDIDVLEEALKNIEAFYMGVSADEIRAGLEKGEFFPRFQPKLSLHEDGSRTIDGAEALVRWNHPSRGELSPGEFITLIEEVGLMTDMTHRLFKTVVGHMRDWSAAGKNPDIAVNLSPTMLSDLTLPDLYSKIVTESGLEPAKITIEITESAVMADATSSAEILTRFRLKGFNLSIDDFGTGYSSLVELHRMPFNELKVDQAFVGSMTGDKEARAIVRLIVNLAHELNLTVCAEGAEDGETLDSLHELRCQKVQGYIVDKPLLAEDFAARIGAIIKKN